MATPASPEDRLLARLILARGLVAKAALDEAVEAAEDAGIDLGEALLVRGLLTDEQLDELGRLQHSGSDSGQTIAPAEAEASDTQIEGPPAEGKDPMVGAKIEGIVIERVLGEGGMGVVYRGQDVELGRTVAVKVLARHITKSPDQVERFKREARAAARLEHPNVVQVYRVGQHRDQHYIVMQFVEGESLAGKLRRDGAIGPIPALKMLIEIGRGLERAHEMGIIHRDIKPDNIMVTTKGEVKLADFGLARDAEGQSEISQTGQVLGTPYYMSPEQCDGLTVDARADIYSLGATFYHMLTGQRPFLGETPLQVMLKHLREDAVPPHKVKRTIPEPVSRLCLLMMAKKAHDRPADVKALIGEVTATLRALGEDVGGSGPIVRRRGGGLLVAGVLGVLLAGGGIGFLVLRGQQTERDAEGALRVARLEAGKNETEGDYRTAVARYAKVVKEYPETATVGEAKKAADAALKRGQQAVAAARAAAEAAATAAADALDPAALDGPIAAWARLKVDATPADTQSLAALGRVRDAIAVLAGAGGTLAEVVGGADGAAIAAVVETHGADGQPEPVRRAAGVVGARLDRARAAGKARAAAAAEAGANRLDAALARLVPFVAEGEPFAAHVKPDHDRLTGEIAKIRQAFGTNKGNAEGYLARGQYTAAEDTLRRYLDAATNRGVTEVAEGAQALVAKIGIERAGFEARFDAVYAEALAKADAGDGAAAAALLKPYLEAESKALQQRARLVLDGTTHRAATPDGAVYLPGGAFPRGEGVPPGTLDRPVYLWKCEVSNAEYAEFLASEGAGRAVPRHWRGGKPPEGREAHPVVWVSRADAIAYAEWLGRKLGQGRFRLPTEMEWERAARGATGRPAPWTGDGAGALAGGDTHAVGALPADATPEGVTDLGGNVAEWTATVAEGRAVVRGGSFDPFAARDPLGRVLVPGAGATPLPWVGFRLVREVE